MSARTTQTQDHAGRAGFQWDRHAVFQVAPDATHLAGGGDGISVPPGINVLCMPDAICCTVVNVACLPPGNLGCL